jgi:CHRD domain/PEP-CTERM motif
MKREILALVSLMVGFAAASEATPIHYSADLSGAGESPPNVSPGTGDVDIVFDPVAHTLQVDVSFQDLLGTVTASHIHCCTAAPFTSTAGVATQTPTFVGFPSGVTSGSYSHLFDTSLAGTWNVAFINANGGTPAGAEAALAAGLADGRAYFNIHTSMFPGGEIRGFLTPVPEPGSLGLMLLGLVAVASTRRRT